MFKLRDARRGYVTKVNTANRRAWATCVDTCVLELSLFIYLFLCLVKWRTALKYLLKVFTSGVSISTTS